MKLSVVIPVYNEAQNLNELYDRLTKVMKHLKSDYEIIFVDDGSSDKSFSILENIASFDKQVRVISFAKNYGQHPATIAGLDASEGEYVITLDSDLQNPPEEIPKLIRQIKLENADMVAGRRRLRQDSFFRKFSSSLTNLFLSALTGVRLNDYGTMLRVMKKDLAKQIAEGYKKERLYFPVLASKITRNIREIDIDHHPRAAGESKYSYFKLFKILVSIVLRYPSALNSFLRKIKILKQEEELYSIKIKI